MAVREPALEGRDDLGFEGGMGEVGDAAFGRDDEIIGRFTAARPELGMAAEDFADPTLDTVAADRITHLLRDGDAEATDLCPSRLELEDEASTVDALRLALDPEEVTPDEDTKALGKTLVHRPLFNGAGTLVWKRHVIPRDRSSKPTS